MLGEALASRFEFPSQAVEDKLGRHLAGRRISDGIPVVLTVLDPQLKAGAAEAAAVVETSRRLAERMLPTVLHCLEAGRTEGGNIYLLSEGTAAETLKALIRARNGLPPATALAVAYRIAAMLQATADTAVVHGDLSAANVHADIVDAPTVRVARFGFSHLLAPYAPARKNEAFHGTAEYMAPEVCSGRPGDASADLYSLGVLMYEMVAGKPPFVSSSPSTTIKRQVYEKPLPLHLVKPGLPKLEAYEKVVTRLLSKDPKGRPADAAELMELLATLKAEAYPESNLDLEPHRGEAIEPICLLEVEAPKPEPGAVAAAVSAAVPQGRETMVFTGLAETVAAAQAQAEEATAAAQPEPAAQAESRPTMAFDPADIQADAAAAAPAPDAAAPAETPAAAAAMTAEPAAGATAPATDAAAAGEAAPIKKPEDWFVEGGHLPESAFPEEDKKESRTFWIIALAFGILVAISGAVWYEAQMMAVPDTEVPPVAEPAKTPPPAKAPAPSVAPVPAPKPAVAPAPEPPRPVMPSPEQQKAERLKSTLAQAQQEFGRDNLVAARRLAEDVLAEDAGNADARKLVAAVEAKLKPPEPPKPAPAPAPERPRAERPKPEKVEKPKPEKPKVEAPPPKPEPAPAPVDQDRLKALIKQGRDAYNKGDYGAAIGAYNNALKMDRNNALVQKLLDQAKAKAGQ